MAESQSRRLPRGRHALAREEVRRIQRSRLCTAMAEVMAEKGYVDTSVADVLQRATVSRQSFYELFDSKLDCFMAAFEGAREILLERLSAEVGVAPATGEPETGNGTSGTSGASADRLALAEQVIGAYLRALAENLPLARLFLVEVYAAGPEAIHRRARTQEILTDAFADLLGARDESVRFACRVIIAAGSALVTPPVAEQDADALLALGPPLIEHVRRLWDAGVLEPAPAAT
ncbi:TetR/AcrR family transcriptional regulator [Actinomadura sp. WMMB 499]|uniref:TetR/AcrR family transcriptional regulator n=1 Tax=Actinomadura sp. WMMB 499 TaxID=1219491 RepID=UPI0012476824|nr:TetR/AcrR family transcriptional regulator [Actinomadura sp. WMMB 499]QFG24229.1 TetR/AcrR family transcriptional regulator [Actinomadura sp. WMMB 499]